MTIRKHVSSLICLILAGAFCARIPIASAQGNFLNPNSKEAAQAPEGDAQKPADPAAGQEPEPTNKLTVEQVQTELDRFQKLEGQDELKKKVVPLLEGTITNLKSEQDWLKKSESYRVDPKVTAQETADYQQEIDKGYPTSEEELKPFLLNSNAGLEASQQKLTELKSRLEVITQNKIDTEKELKELQLELDRRKTRETEVPAELAVVDKRLKEIEQELKLPTPADEPAALTQAKRVVLNAEQQMLLEKRNALRQELLFYQARTENRSARLKLLQKKFEYLQKIEVDLNARKRELEDQVVAKKTREAQKTLKQSSAPLKPLAEEVAELTNLMSGPEGPKEKKKPLEEKLAETKALLTKLQEEAESTKKRLNIASRPQTLAPILDFQRGLLDQISVYHYEESEVQHRQKLNEYLSVQLEYREASERGMKIEEELERLSIEIPEDPEDPLRKEAIELLNKKEEIVTDLKEEYDGLLRVLRELSEAEGELVVFVREYTDYLNEQSMWVPVAEVLQFKDFENIDEGFEPLLNPANWKLLGSTLGAEILRSPIWSGVIVILLILFVPTQTRLKRRLYQLSDEFSENFLAPFNLTKKAFFITLLLPLWIPMLLWLIGYRLQRVLPSTHDLAANPAFVPAFGNAVISVAFVVCVLRLTRYLVKGNGLGEVHFRWPKQQLAKVRLNLHWFTLCVVPLVFLITMIYQAGTSDERRSLGRILMVALLMLTAWFFYRVLAPVQSKDKRSSAVQLSLWHKIMFYGPCCVPLLFALLSISGYTYTAAVLMGRLILSTGVLLVLVMINELCYRWVYIARGRLALEQARQRQEAREAQEAAKGDGESSEAPRIFDPKSAGVDLSSINKQTRHLLNTSFGLAVFFSMWLLWSDAIPILHQPVFGKADLANVAQFTPADESQAADKANEGNQKTTEAAESTPTQDTSSTSAEATAGPDDDTGVTIGDLLLVLLAPIITFIASKNLPGLLEITVLQNLPLDTGIRYAAGTIARYIVVAVGIAVTCNLLGFGMTQISVVLGGLAFGLGFGLQEMFANFVSGIILLFEQPLRVGDIVTLGDVTGSVTRIRIRATTITDWDRKEFIIPNKEFIVGKFNNWTLSDTINRVVILVGVAYGSDTERARSLLLKVCDEHPEVLEEPAPSAVFDAFGDSSLNLTLRCYLPKLDNRLLTIHELHTAIDREFKQAGIEIAFPQMDLHLRSVDPIKNPLPLSQETPQSSPRMYREAD